MENLLVGDCQTYRETTHGSLQLIVWLLQPCPSSYSLLALIDPLYRPPLSAQKLRQALLPVQCKMTEKRKKKRKSARKKQSTKQCQCCCICWMWLWSWAICLTLKSLNNAVAKLQWNCFEKSLLQRSNFHINTGGGRKLLRLVCRNKKNKLKASLKRLE